MPETVKKTTDTTNIPVTFHLPSITGVLNVPRNINPKDFLAAAVNAMNEQLSSAFHEERLGITSGFLHMEGGRVCSYPTEGRPVYISVQPKKGV
jgi:hypothetical protein